MTYSNPVRLGCVGLIVVSGFLAGCSGASGPTLAQVKGKVTVGERPLVNATVLFLPENGPVATGQTDSAGAYTLKTGERSGVALGKARVSVTKVIAAAPVGAMTPEDMKKMAQSGKKQEAPLTEINTKYFDPTTSGLEATVTGDASKDVFDFKLTD